MDGRRFDELTRLLASDQISRRTALRGLLGSGTVALVGLAGLRGVMGQTCRGAGRLSNANANCCSGICDTTNSDPTKRNRCACLPGQENCRGACKDPATAYRSDVKNCGGCGEFCPAPANGVSVCVDGSCGFVCDAGFHACGSQCFAESDPTHCGPNCVDCPAPANGSVTCVGGACDAANGATLCGPTCCAAGQICTNAATGTCCAPNCAGRTCGGDGCGGSCGSCSTGFVCSSDTGTCKNINPSPACAGFSYCGTYGACADGAGACLATIEGGGFCVPINVPFFFSVPCTSSADCPIGDLCMDVGCTTVPPAPGFRCASGTLIS